jgi:Phosphotransferase enzyme family
VPDRGLSPVLSAVEREAAQALLSSAWAEPAEICTADLVWGRSHIVRLATSGGRSAILKRPRRPPQRGEPRPYPPGGEPGREAFGVELASLEYLAGMPGSVAPRLLGADVAAGILLMEELPAGRSLADLLLLGDRAAATAGMVAYASALGSVHAWSIGRTSEFERAQAPARARYSRAGGSRPGWLERIERGRGQFLQAASLLRVATEGADADIDTLIRVLAGERYLSFVHGDLCADNVRLADGRIRIFDFERSGLGPAALDAAYLLAPFPTCWCFADVPADVAGLSMGAYRDALEAGGVEVGEDFDTELTAVLAGWVVARGAMIDGALNHDRPWGTTTMRPRLLCWTARFAAAAARTGAFPRLRQVAEGLNDRFRSLWPDAVIPAYPALAGPGSALARPPEGWEPGI